MLCRILAGWKEVVDFQAKHHSFQLEIKPVTQWTPTATHSEFNQNNKSDLYSAF